MNILSIVIVSFGLAMDAFAVSICSGINIKNSKLKKSLIMALYFGVFQGLMPLIGWFLGSKFSIYIESIDHWIAFILLAIIGGKMLKEGLSHNKDDDTDDNDENISDDSFSHKNLLVLAIATSIDALAMGISFAVLNVNIFLAITLIGVITFITSFIGVMIGKKFGEHFSNKAEIFGGIVLIFIGLKILLGHLFA